MSDPQGQYMGQQRERDTWCSSEREICLVQQRDIYIYIYVGQQRERYAHMK